MFQTTNQILKPLNYSGYAMDEGDNRTINSSEMQPAAQICSFSAGEIVAPWPSRPSLRFAWNSHLVILMVSAISTIECNGIYKIFYVYIYISLSLSLSLLLFLESHGHSIKWKRFHGKVATLLLLYFHCNGKCWQRAVVAILEFVPRTVLTNRAT